MRIGQPFFVRSLLQRVSGGCQTQAGGLDGTSASVLSGVGCGHVHQLTLRRQGSFELAHNLSQCQHTSVFRTEPMYLPGFLRQDVVK